MLGETEAEDELDADLEALVLPDGVREARGELDDEVVANGDLVDVTDALLVEETVVVPTEVLETVVVGEFVLETVLVLV